jgi:hypothetical protein
MKREYDFSKAKRGPVIPVPRGKTRITIRLDEDILAWFRTQVDEAGGGNYQTLINDALRQYIARARDHWRKPCGGSSGRRSAAQVRAGYVLPGGAPP